MNSLLPSSVRRHRNQRELTLEDLSGITGMSPQHISSIESGQRDARLSSIERVASAMGLTLLLVPTSMAPEVRSYIDKNGRSFRKTSTYQEP